MALGQGEFVSQSQTSAAIGTDLSDNSPPDPGGPADGVRGRGTPAVPIARPSALVHIAAHMTARAQLLPVGFTPHRAMQLLLVFAVLAPLAKFMHGSALLVFVCSALAIVPLAGIMGGATEQLASRLGSGVGGLLNATFGNAAELIIALVALHSGLYDVVKASLTGSIIGNILLVLGVSMVAGGVGRERQKFDRSAAAASSTLLALAALALLVPAAFHLVTEGAVARATLTPAREARLEHGLSLLIAIVLFAAYLLSLLFTLRTHRHLYAGASAEHEDRPVAVRRAVLTLLAAT